MAIGTVCGGSKDNPTPKADAKEDHLPMADFAGRIVREKGTLQRAHTESTRPESYQTGVSCVVLLLKIENK